MNRMLVTGLLLAAASAAHAVRLDSGADAQVLIYPLVSAEGDNQTELVVRNLSDRGKALRLLVRDPVAGRPTLSLNIYLADGDVWTGRLVARTQGRAALFSADPSCTFPALSGELALTEDWLEALSEPERAPRSRLNSGYAEVYEMGEIDPALAADCDAIAQRWASGAWSGDAGSDQNADVTPPGGRLTGTAMVRDTRTGHSFVLDPTALAEFRDAAAHTHPDLASRPVLSDVSPAVASVRQVIQLANRRLEVFNNIGFASDPVAAVEAVLTTPALSAEVHSSATAGANAALVLLLPTAPYRLDSGFYGALAASGPFASDIPIQGAVLETDGDVRELSQPVGAARCDRLDAIVNTVSLPNFFNFDHVCELGRSELFVPNNSVRSYLTVAFDGQVAADDGTTFDGLPVIGQVVQTTRGAEPAASAGNFARPMRRSGGNP